MSFDDFKKLMYGHRDSISEIIDGAHRKKITIILFDGTNIVIRGKDKMHYVRENYMSNK